MKGNRANANASAAPSASMSPATAASASAAPSVAATGATGATGRTNATANTNAAANGAGTTAHVEKEKVQQVKQQVSQIKQQHASFRAQARPDKVPAVTFNQNFRIEGSDHWQGSQYEVFRSYHPERHDRNWYHSKYSRVELIGGGYYYWNNNYWYPAWGYEPSAEYYAYDAPIYVGHAAEPPDRVIANVQAELQEMGYYQGDVDGLLGPMTREALQAYQADQGLTPTAVIDEPTLDSLGMS
jgi:Putative peptidoglycan binding domain